MSGLMVGCRQKWGVEKEGEMEEKQDKEREMKEKTEKKEDGD